MHQDDDTWYFLILQQINVNQWSYKYSETLIKFSNLTLTMIVCIFFSLSSHELLFEDHQRVDTTLHIESSSQFYIKANYFDLSNHSMRVRRTNPEMDASKKFGLLLFLCQCNVKLPSLWRLPKLTHNLPTTHTLSLAHFALRFLCDESIWKFRRNYQRINNPDAFVLIGIPEMNKTMWSVDQNEPFGWYKNVVSNFAVE